MPAPEATNTVTNSNDLCHLTVSNHVPQRFYRSVSAGFMPCDALKAQACLDQRNVRTERTRPG